MSSIPDDDWEKLLDTLELDCVEVYLYRKYTDPDTGIKYKQWTSYTLQAKGEDALAEVIASELDHDIHDMVKRGVERINTLSSRRKSNLDDIFNYLHMVDT